MSQRFVSMDDDGTGGNGSLKTHGASIRTSAIPGELLPSAVTMSRLDQLSHVSKNTTSAQTRRISNKAKEILLKSTSIGNASLSGDDRLYLSIHFLGETAAAATTGSSSSGNGNGSSSDNTDTDPAATKAVGFFFKKNLTLGEVLYQTGMTFPQVTPSHRTHSFVTTFHHNLLSSQPLITRPLITHPLTPTPSLITPSVVLWNSHRAGGQGSGYELRGHSRLVRQPLLLTQLTTHTHPDTPPPPPLTHPHTHPDTTHTPIPHTPPHTHILSHPHSKTDLYTPSTNMHTL